MPTTTPVIAVTGLRALQRELRLLAPEHAIAVRRVLRNAVQPIAVRARQRMGYGDELVSAGATRAHIADTITGQVRGLRAVIQSRHPGAAPQEYGYLIAPKGTAIKLKAKRAVRGAVDEKKGEVERALHVGFHRLGARLGWH